MSNNNYVYRKISANFLRYTKSYALVSVDVKDNTMHFRAQSADKSAQRCPL